jgi:hypothetical protein
MYISLKSKGNIFFGSNADTVVFLKLNHFAEIIL